MELRNLSIYQFHCSQVSFKEPDSKLRAVKEIFLFFYRFLSFFFVISVQNDLALEEKKSEKIKQMSRLPSH